MMRYLFTAIALPLAALAVPAHAQQDTTKCATVTVSRASEADVPQLLADAECFSKAMVSAATSQALRLKKARELTAVAGEVPSDDPHAGHAMPPMPDTGWVPALSLDGGAPLEADFPIERGLKLAWGTGGLPEIYNPDEGAFRFTCGGEGPLNYDDPLVYPGQPGASHLHKYWGAMEIDAHSTSDSLARVHHSNCNYGPDTLNRSGYWMPALINAAGQVVSPDLVSVYYKRKTSASPFCRAGNAQTMGICVPLPNKIAFVFGWDAFNPTAKVEGASWYCTGGTGQHYSNLDAVFASGCKAGDDLIANTVAPPCWDGKHLDAPDHRSHMAYGRFDDRGHYKCPASHPYVIPQEENKATWTVTADMIAPDGTSAVYLSSDAMLAGAKPGETLHADYIEAWVTEAKMMWHAGCIERALSCSGGDLGNGKQLIGASQPVYGWTNPEPLTAIP